MATLTVGFGQQYATIGAAVAASRDGDVLQVQAGLYINDFATINTKITLQGVGGMVKMVETNWLDSDKGILITNTDVTVDHFEFMGAIGSSGNGAGIRYQSGSLVVTNSYFHDNQEGILANPWSTGTITIRNSEFANNGTGDGLTHNIYANEIASLTITDSYFHDVPLGNQIKSRAFETIITNTRVFDNNSTSSYSIDIPYGGRAVLTNNIIQQGVNGQNSNMVSFGVEGKTHPGSSLTMTNNTVINDMTSHSPNVLINYSGAQATMTGTQIWGLGIGSLTDGPNSSASGTVNLASRPVLDTSHPWAAAPTLPSLPGAYTHQGSAGADTLTGTAGADNIHGGDGNNYLRGAEGNDQIQGGSGFDDINGNQGNDTLAGGAGNDWVVGGQDNDVLLGEDGNDIVYGNMGNDVCFGGAGNDIIRGGQGDDTLHGGDGDDWLSGDRGTDLLFGGAGADTFSTFSGAGLTRVADFSRAEGDRVRIEDGAAWTVVQRGADVVITVGSATMIILNTDMTHFTSDWIAAA